MQTFIDHNQVAGFLIKFLVIEREPPADVHQRIFLAAHRATVAVSAKLLEDGGHVFTLIAALTLLDEISVFDGSSRIKNDADAVFLCQGANRLQIRHGNRLPSGHIHSACQADVRNFSSTNFFYQFFQRNEINFHVEVSGVGHDCATLHPCKVLFVNDVFIARRGDENVTHCGGFFHRQIGVSRNKSQR